MTNVIVPLFVGSQLVALDVQVERREIDLEAVDLAKPQIGEVCDQISIDPASQSNSRV